MFVTPSGDRFTCMLYNQPIQQSTMDAVNEGSIFLFDITEGFGTDQEVATPQVGK